MATFILNLNASPAQIPSPKTQEIFPSLSPTSEMYSSKHANAKRRLQESYPEAETTLPGKKVQLSQSEYSKKSQLQHPGSSRSRAQVSGQSSKDQERRERVHKKSESKPEDDTLISLISFYFGASGHNQSASVNSSLIRDNLFNLSLTNQTPEESKLEESPSGSSEVSKPLTQAKIPRVGSSDNFQLKEDSTALSETDDNVDQELPNPESPAKTNTLVQDPEQKIVEIQVGEKHQVSKEYIDSLISAPRKSRPIKSKWIPSEENEKKLSILTEGLKGLLKTENISNEERAISILRDASNDVESALKSVSKNLSQWKTKFNSNYVGRSGLRERRN